LYLPEELQYLYCYNNYINKITFPPNLIDVDYDNNNIEVKRVIHKFKISVADP